VNWANDPSGTRVGATPGLSQKYRKRARCSRVIFPTYRTNSVGVSGSGVGFFAFAMGGDATADILTSLTPARMGRQVKIALILYKRLCYCVTMSLGSRLTNERGKR
jgi:hypothetical protein